MTPPALVFDLDGTLVDLPVAIDALRGEVESILAAAGLPGPARPILGAIAAAEAAGQGEAAARARRAIDEAERRAASAAQPCAGAAEALRRARAAGAAVGVLTNNGRSCVAAALAAIGVDAATLPVVSRDEVAAPKPDPAGLVALCGRLAPGGGRVAFVGDGPADVGAAAAARPLVPHELVVYAIPGRCAAATLESAGPCVLVGGVGEAVDRALAGAIG